jgi:RHS repeat-associated protein
VTYDAFGNIVGTSGTSKNNRLANTKERDVNVAGVLTLDDHGMRYYNPVTGRYISRDPWGYTDGLNDYIYVHCNPINHIDPLGLGLWDIVKFFIPRPDQSYEAADEGFKKAMDPNADAMDRIAGGFAFIGNSIDVVVSLIPGKSGLQKKILGGVESGIKAGEKKIAKEFEKEEAKAAVTAAEDGAKSTGKQAEGVKPYETGTAGELRAKSKKGDKLDIDHQPSHASNVERFRQEKGRDPTPAEIREIDKNGFAVAVPVQKHRGDSPTYGGRNSEEQIAEDAADAAAAAKRDSEAMVRAAEEEHKEAAQAAAQQVQQAAGQ